MKFVCGHFIISNRRERKEMNNDDDDDDDDGDNESERGEKSQTAIHITATYITAVRHANTPCDKHIRSHVIHTKYLCNLSINIYFKIKFINITARTRVCIVFI